MPDVEDETALKAHDAASVPPVRDEDENIDPRFVAALAAAIEAGDGERVRALTEDLHEADFGDVLEALEPEHRPRLIELLGRDFDFTALTEVDEAVREEILEELEPATVAEGVRDLDSDDAVTILESLDEEDQAEILDQLPAIERVALQRAPRLSGGLGRPADADRVHRRAAVLDGRADDRLHARDARPP